MLSSLLRRLYEEGYPNTKDDLVKTNKDLYREHGHKSSARAYQAVSEFHRSLRLNRMPGWVMHDSELSKMFIAVSRDCREKRLTTFHSSEAPIVCSQTLNGQHENQGLLQEIECVQREIVQLQAEVMAVKMKAQKLLDEMDKDMLQMTWDELLEMETLEGEKHFEDVSIPSFPSNDVIIETEVSDE